LVSSASSLIIRLVKSTLSQVNLKNSPAGENINWVARMLGHKSPVVTLEKYNRFVPNLTRWDGKALLEANEMAKRSGVS
jgi:hypothetical protein